MNVADFEQLLEDATGEDLTPFFEAQALQPGFSTWVMDSITTGPDNGCLPPPCTCNKNCVPVPTTTKRALDVTVWDANWDTTLVHARVGGNTIKSRFGTRSRLSWSASMRTVA